jgi:hypothetical protein
MVTEPEGSTALIPLSGRLLDTILSQFQPPVPTTCSPSSSYPSFFFSVLRVDILRRFLLPNPLWFLVSPNLAAYQVYINRLDLTILKTVALVLPRSTHEKYENFPRSRLCFVLRISYLGVIECFVLRHVSQLRSGISSKWSLLRVLNKLNHTRSSFKSKFPQLTCIPRLSLTVVCCTRLTRWLSFHAYFFLVSEVRKRSVKSENSIQETYLYLFCDIGSVAFTAWNVGSTF